MFKNDVSYLYSDDCLTSSSSSEKEELNYFEYEPFRTRITRKTIPTCTIGRRSKHVISFGEETMKREKRREKHRIIARQLKVKQKLFEENLYQKVKELENEKSNLENHVMQLQSHKQNLQDELISNYSMDSIADKEKIPLFLDHYSDDFHLLNMSLTNILNFNDEYDNHLES